MGVNDTVYDTDAYIKGKLIGKKQNGNFIVSWDNGVIGEISEDDKSIKIIEKGLQSGN